MVAVPQRKRLSSGAIAGTVTAVSAACLLLAINLDSVGHWFYQQDNLLEAMYCYQIMTAVDGMLGFRDWRLSTAWSSLSQCYSKLGRTTDAVFAGKQARAVMSSVVGANSANVYLMDAEIAQCLSRGKRYPEAEKQLTDALAGIDALKTPSPWAKAYVLSVLTDTYMDEKKYAEAEKSALALLPLDDRLQVENHSSPFGAREKLVELYCKTNRYDDAEEIAATGIPISRASQNVLTMAGAHDSYGRALLAKGRLVEARAEFDRSLEFLTTKYGAGDHKVAFWRSRYQQLINNKNPFLE